MLFSTAKRLGFGPREGCAGPRGDLLVLLDGHLYGCRVLLLYTSSRALVSSSFLLLLVRQLLLVAMHLFVESSSDKSLKVGSESSGQNLLFRKHSLGRTKMVLQVHFLLV